VRQQEIRYRYSTDVDEYMRRIEAKTATLLAACCDIGALLGQIPQDALHEYGRLLGLAFQITDDVLDYMGNEGQIGKPIGQDIAEGFATLPLMLAKHDHKQDHMQDHLLDSLLQDGRKLSPHQAAQVVDIVRNSHGPRRALERAKAHANEAKKQLDALSPSKARDALAALTDYVVTRKL
jgi:geranylgeranyl pyrophosphate synthase